MNTIKFKEVNCKNCYKCIRSCPVKAISLKNEHAQVIEDGCILCGKCLQVCPQNAKSVENDIDKVKNFIEKRQKVYASIAPSFAPVFNLKNPEVIEKLFKKLGFAYVEETAVGALRVTSEYRKLMKDKQMKNIITTCCPSINSLVEKHYPELIAQMAPVVSPMIAHGKMLKDKYGSRIKVIFIGPCLAKKEEFKDSINDKVIDAVITFDEFEDWLTEEGIEIEKLTADGENEFNGFNMATRFYPAPGGIIKSIGSFKGLRYKPIKFDGIDNCMEILNEISKGNIEDYFIEMNSCNHGCLGGPCMKKEKSGFLDIREKLMEFISKTNNGLKAEPEYNSEINISKEFKNKAIINIPPDDKHIEKILRKIGKFTKEQELNCGACGYQSCREKAVAVINGKAETYMCLPYMRERAESISNVIIHSTPNAIFALSEELQIHEANAAARRLFRLMGEEFVGRNIYEYIECPDIYDVRDSKKDIINRKFRYENYDLIVEQSILYIKENQMILIVMKDITQDVNKQAKLHKLQGETVEVAQKVIEKQMRVAQEIASLLGETTAETKVALSKLKKSIQIEMGDQI